MYPRRGRNCSPAVARALGRMNSAIHEMTPPLPKERSLWRHPDFTKLWVGQVVSQVGTQITFIGLPLVAITTLDASPFELGVLNALDFAPFALVGLYAGVLADRLERRRLMIVADVVRAVILLSVPLAYFLDVLTMWQLFAVAVLVSSATVFFDVAYQSYLPGLVGHERLVDGNAKLELGRSAAQVSGPGIAGGLIQALTAPVAILVDSITFLASASAIRLIRSREASTQFSSAEHSQARSRSLDSIREGLRFVFRHPYLRHIVMSSATANLGLAMVEAIYLLYASRSLGISAAVIGAIFAAGNAGLIVAAVAARHLAGRVDIGRMVLLGASAQAAGLLLVPLAHGSLAVPVLIGAQALRTGGTVTFNIAQVSFRQTVTPAPMLGRMNATMRALSWSVIPAGALIGGAIAEVLGIRATLLLGALVATVAVAPAIAVRSARLNPAL